MIVAEQVRGEDQAVGGDAGAAAGDEWLRGVDARRFEETFDLFGRLEASVVTVERSEGEIARAWNVPRRDPGARVGFAAFEAALAARIEQRVVHPAEKLLFG